MSVSDCTAFLQWALPRLELRWPGFRKVRTQVCKRVMLRMRNLGLESFAAYQARLEADSTEWRVLDECCHITISRFFRDGGAFEVLRTRILPELALRAQREGRNAQIWSAGCASGEEPYTIRILWDIEVAKAYPTVSLSITASDVDKAMLARAHQGCFAPSSPHELPPPLVGHAFDRIGPRYCIKSNYRRCIYFVEQDLRSETPLQLFDLIFCRNVAFTYFAIPLQRKVLARVLERLRPSGYLVIGADERLPEEVLKLLPLMGKPQLFQKKGNMPLNSLLRDLSMVSLHVSAKLDTYPFLTQINISR